MVRKRILILLTLLLMSTRSMAVSETSCAVAALSEKLAETESSAKVTVNFSQSLRDLGFTADDVKSTIHSLNSMVGSDLATSELSVGIDSMSQRASMNYRAHGLYFTPAEGHSGSVLLFVNKNTSPADMAAVFGHEYGHDVFYRFLYPRGV